VRLPTPEAGAPEAAAALHFSPGALAATLRAAWDSPLLREEVAPLARELLRLGAWLEPDAVRVLAAAARSEAPLLEPLLAHLRAQAAATLAVLFPGPLGARRMAGLLPYVGSTGSGVTPEALGALVGAAAAHGDLPLALALLETAPPSLIAARHLFPHGTAARLVELAEDAGQPLLATRLAAAGGAGGAGWGALPFAASAQPHRLVRAPHAAPLLHA